MTRLIKAWGFGEGFSLFSASRVGLTVWINCLYEPEMLMPTLLPRYRDNPACQVLASSKPFRATNILVAVSNTLDRYYIGHSQLQLAAGYGDT